MIPSDIPDIIEPGRADQLRDSAIELIDLATATGDESLAPHLAAISMADELMFVHEAMEETLRFAGDTDRAAEEAILARHAGQLRLWHLDRLDRHLSPHVH